MKLSLEAARLFLDYLKGNEGLDDVLRHPAYQAVFSHSRQLRQELSERDIRLAVAGNPSGYYGLENVRDNLGLIQRQLNYIEANSFGWLPQMEKALARVFPSRDASEINIYPILGYDVGIGHKGCVCMNVNLPFYNQVPQEFFYLAIHEAFHVLYEQTCPLPDISGIDTAQKQLELYYLLMQNEGFAVYTPLELRRRNGQSGSECYPTTEDYLAIENHAWIKRIVALSDQLITRLQTEPAMDMNEFLAMAFGAERLVYRVGCVLVEQIEASGGLAAVRRALALEPARYIQRYSHLLDKYR